MFWKSSCKCECLRIFLHCPWEKLGNFKIQNETRKLIYSYLNSLKFLNIKTEISVSLNFKFLPCIIIIVNHFYFPTNALNYTKFKRLKSTFYKSLKDKILKNWKSLQHVSQFMWSIIREYRAALDWNYSWWFRDIFVVCLVGVWQRNFWTCGVCVRYGQLGAGRTVHTHTHTTVISVKHSSVLPDDGSHKLRNMLEWFSIF